MNNHDTKRQPAMRMWDTLSKASVAVLVLGTVFSPLSTMAASSPKTSSTLRMHAARIAVNSQVLRNTVGILTMTDPSTNKRIALMPIWYTFYLLKPYGLSYQWDAHTNSLYILTSTSQTRRTMPMPKQVDGHLKV